MIEIVRYGEAALLVNFEQSIDVTVNQLVIQLNSKLKNIAGIEFLIPAYCSLTVGFNPSVIKEKDLIELINKKVSTDDKVNSNRHLKIPVCYDEQFGLDIADVCNQKNITKDELVKIHTGTTYNVYMMGFIPGFAYMGKTSEAIHCSRKNEPRKKIEGRSVAIAGAQTGIYPNAAPGGWQIIGKTPIDIVQDSTESPFLFQPTDQVTFYAITVDEFFEYEKAIDHGEFQIDITIE